MGLLYWFCRCIPALSLLAWLLVSYQALWGRWPGSLASRSSSSTSSHLDHQYDHQWRFLGANAWELLYVVYSVLAHLSACVLFPARLCWAVFQLTGEVRRARAEAHEIARPYAESEASAASSSAASSGAGTAGSSGGSTLVDDKGSMLSLSAGSQTPDTPISRAGTPRMGDKSRFEDLAESVVHAIILPSYKEDLDTMRETLSVLASHVLAKSSYDVRSPCLRFLACNDSANRRHVAFIQRHTNMENAGLPGHGAARPGRAEHRSRPHQLLPALLPAHLLHPAPGRHPRRGGGQEQQCGLGGAPAEPQLHRPGEPAELRDHGHGLYVFPLLSL